LSNAVSKDDGGVDVPEDLDEWLRVVNERLRSRSRSQSAASVGSTLSQGAFYDRARRVVSPVRVSQILQDCTYFFAPFHQILISRTLGGTDKKNRADSAILRYVKQFFRREVHPKSEP
jgi:hypothetical protein